METNPGSARDRILTLLRRADCTVNRLAAELGVTDNAIRPHLEALEAAGLVTRTDVLRKGVGKPAHVYALTAAGNETFAKAYAPVLRALLGAMAERLEPGEEDAILRDAGRRAAGVGMGAGAGAAEPGCDLRARADLAVAMLGALGGDAEVTTEEGEQGAGRLWIRSSGCPLASVVCEHPEACQLAEALISQVVGTTVREHCDRTGRPRCCFEIDGSRLLPRDAEDRAGGVDTGS